MIFDQLEIRAGNGPQFASHLFRKQYPAYGYREIWALLVLVSNNGRNLLAGKNGLTC